MIRPPPSSIRTATLLPYRTLSRPDSGGAGKHRGGDGVVRRMRFLEPMTATILSLHRATDPYGLAGGEPGERGRNTVIRADGRRESLKGSERSEGRRVGKMWVRPWRSRGSPDN